MQHIGSMASESSWGEGEITDIDVKNGIVYATGLDENMDAVYFGLMV